MRVPPDVLADPARPGPSPPPARGPDRSGPGRRGRHGLPLCRRRRGLCVSLIQSNYNGFGSGVTVPGLGVNLHNRGAYFRLEPDHVNVLAPGKRTLHTLMPALAARAAAPGWSSAPWAPTASSRTQVQLLARLVDEGADPAAALAAPVGSWTPATTPWPSRTGSLSPCSTACAVAATTSRSSDPGGPDGPRHLIRIDEDGLTAASDPRCEGLAAASDPRSTARLPHPGAGNVS